MKGEGIIDKERTKRGITYINILHTLQKVERKLLGKLERKLLDKLERKLLGKLERKLCKLGNAPKILFFIFFMFTKTRNKNFLLCLQRRETV